MTTLGKGRQARKGTKQDSKKLTKILTKKLFLQNLLKQKDKKFHKVENNLPIKLNPYVGK